MHLIISKEPRGVGGQKSFAELFQKRPRPQSFSNQWKMLEKTYALPIRTRRSALCGGEFRGQSGGLFPKEGALCKRERPLKAFPIRQLFLFGQYFGSCCARQYKQERFSAVKKREYRQRMQAEGFALSTPTSPFLKGLTPKSMIL